MAVQFNPRWFVWLLVILCIVAIPIGFLGHKANENLSSDGELDSGDLTTPYTDRLQVIHLSGIIVDKHDSSLFGDNDTALSVIKALRKAVSDDHVKGILLRINSPGGTVPTSQEINDEVKAVRSKNKPVVVSMADVAASGGYYIACAADKIVAQPGTLTGSIGVIFNTMNLKGLADKFGVQPVVVKSGTFKDIGSPFRPMTPEDKAILQALIIDSYDQFVQAVASGRKMPIETVKKIADGRIYSGRQALKLGLVDQLGGYDTAMDLLQSICQERYQTKVKYPVEEVSGGGLLSSLTGLKKGLKFSMEDWNMSSKFIPEFMSARYYHMPLWIMQ
jgi:protease IV